ncbi:RnfH family protein [Psychrobacter sp. I-STPA10]|uniref:RnfH family protein n=1 Tax=Psychrobacter sp. I-STPA10 TaxID=2585769 RepID=UPI001E57EA74|nr:RnfH family protein [Psychrobacter sp. I-STPA10]
MNEVMIGISLAYAPSSTEQWYLEIEVPRGSSIFMALQLSGWLQKDRELAQWCQQHQDAVMVDKKDWRVGVFSQKQPLSYELAASDRIEIYRPLHIDPMNKRKKRAAL